MTVVNVWCVRNPRYNIERRIYISDLFRFSYVQFRLINPDEQVCLFVSQVALFSAKTKFLRETSLKVKKYLES